MNYEEFKTELMNLLSLEIDDRGLDEISLRFDTIKSPDGFNDRLIVYVGKSNMSMAFRLQEIFDSVSNGESMDRAVIRLVNSIADNIKVIKTKEDDVKTFISDYEQVKEHTFLRMVPGDSPILDEAPHRMIADMGVVVNINLEDVIRSMIDRHECPSPADIGITTYIVSNKSGFHGAAVIAYPGSAQQIAEKLGGGYFCVPSSTHEWLIILDDGTPNPEDLNKMIEDVNNTVLNPRDILSYQCYHYDAKN